MKKFLLLAIASVCAMSSFAAVNTAPAVTAVDDEDNTNVVQYIFENKTNPYPYRIPAIAKASNGRLIAIGDYRICKNDIGYGRVDLHYRLSEDNGQNWSEEKILVEGDGKSGSPTCGYGDAAIVADAHSSEVLVVCVTGNTTYGSATRSNPNRVAVLRSSDNGETWSQPEEITESIYTLFDASKLGAVQSLFFGSGRICQSRQIKVGEYFRLYAALCARPNGNRVLYSDDFGHTWHSLGTIDKSPAPDGDEPKIEELPTGDVVLSSRMNGGRYYNIFTYTDKKNAEGTWGTVANSSSISTGVKAVSNSTNGEILVIPAKKIEDGSQAFIALQSVPLGSGRYNVGIYYKALTGADYVNPTTFASNWNSPLQVSTKASAYSTMCIQADGRIAFYYEEDTFGANNNGYTLVYHPFKLEELTEGKYSIDMEYSPFAADIEDAKAKVEGLYGENPLPYEMVGEGLEGTEEYVKAAYEAYVANPSDLDLKAAFNEAFNSSCRQVESGVEYVLVNVETLQTLQKDPSKWMFVGATLESYGPEDVWVMTFNENKSAYSILNKAASGYLKTATSEGSTVGGSATASGAGYFQFDIQAGCKVLIKNVASTCKAPYLQLTPEKLVATGDNTQLSAKWYIVLAKNSVIDGVQHISNDNTRQYYDISGRRISDSFKGIAISRDGKKIIK